MGLEVVKGKVDLGTAGAYKDFVDLRENTIWERTKRRRKRSKTEAAIPTGRSL